MSETTLTLQRLTDIGYLNLRGAAASEEFLAAVSKVTALALPVIPNTVVSATNDIYWLGPDEWLLLGDNEDVSRLSMALTSAVSAMHAAVNDLSGAYVTYRLSGDNAQLLLAKGCTIDLEGSAFGYGACAQTSLGKANVILRPLQDKRGYDVIVRRSFSDYVWQWLLRAGREHKIEVA
jgi:sarcosine oxidase subunit gamma